MSDRLKRTNCVVSAVLGFILQLFCLKYIDYDKPLLIFSTILYIISFISVFESFYFIFKKKNVRENLRRLCMNVSAIFLTLTLCLGILSDIGMKDLILVLFCVLFLIFIVSSLGYDEK